MCARPNNSLTHNRDYSIRDRLTEPRLKRETQLPVKSQQSNGSKLNIEDRLRRIFEESPCANYVSTPEGKLIACNSAFVRMFGFNSIEEAMNTNLSSLYENTRARKAFLQRLKVRGQVEHHQTTLRHVDGSTVHVLGNTSGSFNDQGELVEIRGYLIDDSDRQNVCLQHQQSQKMEAMEHLATSIAHDFNNLLTVIIGQSELILDSLSSDAPFRQRVSSIKRAGQSAAALIQQLLQLNCHPAGSEEGNAGRGLISGLIPIAQGDSKQCS